MDQAQLNDVMDQVFDLIQLNDEPEQAAGLLSTVEPFTELHPASLVPVVVAMYHAIGSH